LSKLSPSSTIDLQPPSPISLPWTHAFQIKLPDKNGILEIIGVQAEIEGVQEAKA